jgi:L-asparaginase
MTEELTYTLHRQADQDKVAGGPSHPSKDNAVLLIYTGGTIGAVPADRNDPKSPLVIADWAEFDLGIPQLGALRAKGMRIDAVALDKPLDSTNIEPRHWSLFVQIIDAHYDDYMGFVILHGTDTMVFTASALSFMLGGVGKPVVLTGSQIPILDHPHTDGTRNLVNALRIAGWKLTGIPNVAEVCIAFDDVLLRGNRARKVSADTAKGFASPNFPELGTLDDPIVINTELLWPHVEGSFKPQVTLDADVVSIQIFPGIQNSEVLRKLLGTEELRGAVLQTYGAGNGPTAPGFLDPIEEAVAAGKVVVDVTQCTKGSVRLGQYETGVGLMTRGVLSGSDMTPEAALCKLMVLLGSPAMSSAVGKFVQQSRAGEQSESLYETTFEGATPEEWQAHDDTKRIEITPSSHDTGWDRDQRLASAWLHLHDAVIDAEGPIELEVYFQAIGVHAQRRGFAAKVRKEAGSEPHMVSIDVTAGLKALEPRVPPPVTIVIDGQGSLEFASATLIVIVDDRTRG